MPMPVDHNNSITICTKRMFGVWKSSIILRYVNKRFDEKYKASIGVGILQVSVKILPYESYNAII